MEENGMGCDDNALRGVWRQLDAVGQPALPELVGPRVAESHEQLRLVYRIYSILVISICMKN